jgi:hypothetical protein
MSAGSQNKYGLDELEFIPGDIPFNKVSAWNKLQERMGEKKTKKNYWYLAAASIVLVLSAGIFLWNGNQNNNKVNKGAVSVNGTQGSPPAINKNFPEIIEHKISANNIDLDKRSLAGNKNLSSKKVKVQKVKTGKNLSEVKTAGSISGLNTEPSPLLSTSPDVFNSIPPEVPQNQTAAQLQPVKKKLKVLHHNQLQNTLPVTNPAYSARSGNIQGITVFGKNKSADFIKIKITTPN